MGKIAKIIGPPGTGKTEYMARQVLKDCENLPVHLIGAVSLTNAAVNELRLRVAAKLGINPDAAKNFGTVHSHCFRLCGFSREQMAESAKNLRTWNETHPTWVRKAPGGNTDDATPCFHGGGSPDEMFGEIQALRSRMIPPEKWGDRGALKQLAREWNDWMARNDLIDFTGLLERVLAERLVPDKMRILYIDEAQDLSPLAFEIVRMWGEHCQKVVFIGDPDQAIFRFAGARPESLTDLSADYEKILSQSFRVPPKVHGYARKIITQVTGRTDAMYAPDSRFCEGSVGMADEPDIGPGNETHMIIARTHFALSRWLVWLRERGIPYHNPYRPEEKSWNIADTKTWTAARTWLRLFSPEPDETGEYVWPKCHFSDIQTLGAACQAKTTFQRGAKKKLSEMNVPHGADAYMTLPELYEFGLFSEDFMASEKQDYGRFLTFKGGPSADFVRTLMASDPEKIIQKIRVVVGTVHSVKGGQADHVWFDPSLPAKIRKSLVFQQDTEFADECRIAYVAATRAKKTLRILRPQKISAHNPVLPYC